MTGGRSARRLGLMLPRVAVEYCVSDFDLAMEWNDRLCNLNIANNFVIYLANLNQGKLGVRRRDPNKNSRNTQSTSNGLIQN